MYFDTRVLGGGEGGGGGVEDTLLVFFLHFTYYENTHFTYNENTHFTYNENTHFTYNEKTQFWSSPCSSVILLHNFRNTIIHVVPFRLDDHSYR